MSEQPMMRPAGPQDAEALAVTHPQRADAPRDLELWGIYLLAGRHGRGMGQRLFDATVGERGCFLRVAEQNEKARAFHRRNGLATEGARRTSTWMEHLPVVRMVR